MVAVALCSCPLKDLNLDIVGRREVDLILGQLVGTMGGSQILLWGSHSVAFAMVDYWSLSLEVAVGALLAKAARMIVETKVDCWLDNTAETFLALLEVAMDS